MVAQHRRCARQRPDLTGAARVTAEARAASLATGARTRALGACATLAGLGACLSIPREPRWLCKGADARRAAQGVVDSTPKPRNAADAPCRANPQGPDGL